MMAGPLDPNRLRCHMRTRFAFLLAILLSLALVPAGSAQAEPEQWAAADGNLVAVSQGYGHGIGMSQYGAKGRAEAGQTVNRILNFYYPGTSKGHSAGLVRVWITGDSNKNLIVRPTKGLRVVDLGNRKSYTLPTGKATAWRLVVKAGQTRLTWLKNGVWRGYRPGGKLLTGVGEFRSSARLLNVYYGGANHPYRGAMRLVDGRTINVLSLDNYLKGVIPTEMPALWATRALRVQAVAARTYAAFERAANRTRSYQICDTSQCQVYKGYDAEHPNTNAAIIATAGRVVEYQGELAFTQFSASNGGHTAKGAKPYQVGVPDPFDTAYQDRELAIGPLTTAKIEAAYPSIGSLERVRVQERDTDQRVLWVRLQGSDGTIQVRGTEFRSLIGLRSHYFSFTS